MALEIFPHVSHDFRLFLQERVVEIRTNFESIFFLACSYIEKYFKLGNIFFKKFKPGRDHCIFPLHEIFGLGEALVKTFGK
jgi:hypothetical protein